MDLPIEELMKVIMCIVMFTMDVITNVCSTVVQVQADCIKFLKMKFKLFEDQLSMYLCYSCGQHYFLWCAKISQKCFWEKKNRQINIAGRVFNFKRHFSGSYRGESVSGDLCNADILLCLGLRHVIFFVKTQDTCATRQG